jgi:hypothetical protein
VFLTKITKTIILMGLGVTLTMGEVITPLSLEKINGVFLMGDTLTEACSSIDDVGYNELMIDNRGIGFHEGGCYYIKTTQVDENTLEIETECMEKTGFDKYTTFVLKRLGDGEIQFKKVGWITPTNAWTYDYCKTHKH